MDKRASGQMSWAVLFMLAVGSGGCSTLSGSLPVLEPTASLPSFEGVSTIDLTPAGLLLRTDESAGNGNGNDAQQVEGSLDKGEPEADQPSAETATDGAGSDESLSAGEPAAPPSPLLAQVKPGQAEGPGDLFRDPEPVKDENYDPFQKEEGTVGEIEEYDPWEPFNQAIFTFNRKVDEYVLRPVAKVYDKVIPDPLEFGIRNVFQNVRFAPRFFNNLAQGKFKGAGIELGSFLINTSFGLGGLFDFAREVFGLETPAEDTGQTLGVYGAKPGPYLVLPFLGSFTLRDGIGFIGDLALDPFNWLVMPAIKLDGAPKLITKEDTILFGQLGTRAGYMVNERSINIETTFEGVEEATVDLYGAVRNAYLQKRAKAIKQ